LSEAASQWTGDSGRVELPTNALGIGGFPRHPNWLNHLRVGLGVRKWEKSGQKVVIWQPIWQRSCREVREIVRRRVRQQVFNFSSQGYARRLKKLSSRTGNDQFLEMLREVSSEVVSEIDAERVKSAPGRDLANLAPFFCDPAEKGEGEMSENSLQGAPFLLFQMPWMEQLSRDHRMGLEENKEL